MIQLTKAAEAAAQSLFDEMELPELYALLGYQADLLEGHPEETTTYSPRLLAPDSGKDQVSAWETIGERIFHRWNIALYKLICGSEAENQAARNEIENLFTSKYTLIGGIAVLLTTQFGVAPAIAMVIATIVIKRFFDPALAEVCGSWKAHLPEAVWDEGVIARD